MSRNLTPLSPAEQRSMDALVERRDQAWNRTQEIRKARETAGGEFTADERRAYDQALDETESLSRAIDNFIVGDPSTTNPIPEGRTSNAPEEGFGRPLAPEARMADLVDPYFQPQERELSLRKYLRGMVTGEWQDADNERRAMAEGQLATGGYMLPAPLSARIIDLARNQTRVIQAGATVIPMANKTLDVPVWQDDPTAAWRNEGQEILPSDATLNRVRLDAKSLAGLTKVTRELLEDAPGIENELRRAFAAQFALTVDHAALYGSGVDPEPRGVYNASGVEHLTPWGANGGIPTNYDFLIDAVGALEDVNETPNAQILSPRTGRTLGKLKDSTDQPLRVPSALDNVRRLTTNQVPTDRTLGTGVDTSDVFTADWSYLYLGLRTSLQIQVLSERYAETGHIGLLCWWRGDIQVARPSAFNVTEGALA